MSNSPEDYELFHAGVKGMKWGVRKARPNDGSTITTRHFKKFEEQVRESRRKGEKEDGQDRYSKGDLDYIQRANKKRESMDKSLAEYRKSTSKGKTRAQYILGGPGMGYGYRSARGSGASRGKALVLSTLSGPAAGVLYREAVAIKAGGKQ